jgi:diguanylate cyclase (GGDEF)-like protein
MTQTIAPRASDGLAVYRLMQRIPFGRSYVLRLLALCFLGAHVPLIVATLWVLGAAEGGVAAHQGALLVVLVGTLVGTGFTLAAVHFALSPVLLSARALRAYVERRILPDLPLDGRDEAGELMAAVRTVCEQLERELVHQEHLASTDGLTGVLNRRAFFARSASVIAINRTAQRPVALAIFDIDHFKKLNDAFGHPAGDAAIKAVAQVMQQFAGPSGLVGRLGGEEFALLLPRVDEGGAQTRAELIRLEVANLLLDECPDHPMSVSGGVTMVRLDEEATLDRAIERADHALYAAKEAGRNRVVWAPAPVAV